MSQLPEVDFWFDFASTYSYPAAMRIEEAAGRYGSMVHWRPFLLGPIFKERGWNDSPFNIYPAKGRYMWRDLERLCAALQIPFRKPTEFPRRSLLATRIACAGQETDWIAEFARRVYTANFAEDLDVAKPAVLLRCMDGLVEDPASMLAAARGQGPKAGVRRATQRAMELGIFGAPSFIAGGELFWGNDRLEAALEWSRSCAQ